MGYLLQAGRGQLAIINHARPIPEVLKDERTPPYVKKLLVEIPAIKSYGEKYGLKPTTNYVDYTKLDRSAATWVVSASPPLKFEPREWSFPFVGSFTYLGWFDAKKAVKYAQKLHRETGDDVDVRGASAFSTLGWFRDPVLSTMLSKDEDALGYLANTVLHESVHTTVYIKGQSYFNESIANWVADMLTPGYLEQAHGRDSPQYQAYEKSRERQETREGLLRRAYMELERLYASAVPDSQKLAQKKVVLDKLKAELKTKHDINNATLIQYRTYGVGRASYEKLFNACQQSWPRFWKAIRMISGKSFNKPQQEEIAPVILPIMGGGCPKG